MQIINSDHVDYCNEDTDGKGKDENSLLSGRQPHAGENGYREGEDGEIGDDVDGGGADEFGKERDAFCVGGDGCRPSSVYGTALEDVHKGEDDSADVDNGEGCPGRIAQDNLGIFGES